MTPQGWKASQVGFNHSAVIGGVDRKSILAQSVCGVLMGITLSPVKKGLFIVVAVMLAPVLLVGVVALAAGDWQQVGATAGGDQVLVSSVTARKNGLRTAWIRVEYKEPTKLPQGGPFVELRARVRFNCASGSGVPTAVSNSEWFYSRDRSGKLVVSKKTHRDDQFGQVAEGDFGEIAREFVCKQK
ncbi:MAG: surface-adhesin E family protein [Candidatus Sulfotelmatobacter sp.]|jgi:hypothetical protein